MGIGYFVVYFLGMLFLPAYCQNSPNQADKDKTYSIPDPTIMISILVRNEAHKLPYFLYYLEKLDYPKNKIYLWIRTDHNIDESEEIINKWLQHVNTLYMSVDFLPETDRGMGYPNESSSNHWTAERHNTVIELRQQSLQKARDLKLDYIFILDCDAIFLEPMVLWDLINEKRTIIAPMLNNSLNWQANNFYAKMDQMGTKFKTEHSTSIIKAWMTGCHVVDLVDTAILIDLRARDSRHLVYNQHPAGYKGPRKDSVILAQNAKLNRVNVFLLNRRFYGHMCVELGRNCTLEYETDVFLFMRTSLITYHEPLQKLSYINNTDIPIDNMGLDKIYVINLERRVERKQRMLRVLREIGLEATVVKAVDGRQLNSSYLREHEIGPYPEYLGLNKHPLTVCEVGCFLSHYYIWADVIANNFKRVMILEDDCRFLLQFRTDYQEVIREADTVVTNWDFLYLSRKARRPELEQPVRGVRRLVWPDYSLFLVAYILNHSGAKKLVGQKPLHTVMPSDEYVAAMMNKHPTKEYMTHFHPRNLIALSATPLLAEPSFYWHEAGHISDTTHCRPLSDIDRPDKHKDEL